MPSLRRGKGYDHAQNRPAVRRYFTRKRFLNAWLFLRHYGFRLFVKEVLKELFHKPWLFSTKRYAAWIQKNEPDERDLSRQREAAFRFRPKISIIVPVYNTPPRFLNEMLDSVLGQTYSNWELCISDGSGKEHPARAILEGARKHDSRIKVHLLPHNKGIAGNTNEALSLSTGDYAAFLDHDDTLSPFALFEIVKALNASPEADFIYSDEDVMPEDGQTRFEPHFKPDWSPDLLRSFNYITHLLVIKKDLLARTGVLREGFEGSQDYDLILRATELAHRILHIPKVLYHWRMHAYSSAGKPDVKPYAFESGRRALMEHLSRAGLKGEIEYGDLPGLYKVSFRIDNPRLSIIIPNRDHAGDLDNCVRSILNKTTYENYEIIIVENGSRENRTIELYDKLREIDNMRIIRWDKPFNFSAVNNFAARHAEGSVFLFLNNDTEVINGDWLKNMLEHASRDKVGAVGAKLYYRNDTIQHAGIIIGSGGTVMHPHRFLPGAAFGYRSRLRVIINAGAVTGACLMLRREVFEEVGGFDENYAITFGDIDFCMKLRAAGYLIVWTPYAELYHEELKTRGSDALPENQVRFLNEKEYFLGKWIQAISKGDPFYSPNLVQDKEDFSIRL